MRTNRAGGALAVTVTVGFALALSLACSSLVPEPEPITFSSGLVTRCKKGTLPCGDGCMPLDAACCDDGTMRTSAYCTSSAGGGCRPNPNKTCKSKGLGSPVSEFCCSTNTDDGSFDCGAGSHHCGAPSCTSQVCCADDASAVDCPVSGNSSACNSRGDGVLCGVESGICTVCPLGSCCASSPTASDGWKCLAPTGTCTGTRAPGSGSSTSSSSSGGGSCRLVWDCKQSSQCATVYGAKTGSAAEPDLATCNMVCKSQGACTCQGC